MMTGMGRSKRDKRGKLEVTSIGLYEDQLTHIEVLMRVTGKSKGRIIRESVDAYFANYRVRDYDTLGEAERRFREGQEANTGH
jgi:predicted DNA-binding protein